MKIGFNCFNINPKYQTALNTFTFDLLDWLLETNRGHEFVIFIKHGTSPLFEKYAALPVCTIVELPGESKTALFFRGLAISTRLKGLYASTCKYFYKAITDKINSYAIDVFYTPTNFLFPYDIKAPKVVTLHEIQHLHHPELFQKYDRLNRIIHFENTLQKAGLITVGNETIKNELLSLKRIAPEKIAVLPFGINTSLYSQPQGNEDVLKKYNLPPDFLFYPAQLWRHKDHLTILRSILLLNDMYKVNVPFVFTGSKTRATQYIFDFIDQNKMKDVYYLGAIPKEDLIALMQAARYFITASDYESGFTQILEAATAKAPIIAADIPIIREIAKDFKINIFDKGDHESLTTLLLTIWSDSTTRQIQTHENAQTVRKYSWKEAAPKYFDAFEKVFSKRS
jgi:glycosyltransferase involved in cell wall biosynthesis